MSLSNVLITGSSSGLGNYLAFYFSKKGHDVLIHGRNENKLKETERKILENASNVKYVIADLRKSNDIELLCKAAIKEDVKILINNAGIICPNLPFEKINNQIIDDMISVNLIAPIKIINALSSHLEYVININSMVGLEAKKNRTLYASAKWGLKGFSDSLKKEKVKFQILDVYPTNIKTYPERENAMEIDFVMNEIYEAMIKCKRDLVLDGRK